MPGNTYLGFATKQQIKPTNYVRKRYNKGGKKNKKLIQTIRKEHHKMVPSQQIRFTADMSLLGSATPTATFNWLELSGYFAQGTLHNQKMCDKLYVSGLKLTISALNNNPNSSKIVRVMVVRNKNPADTLDSSGWSDIYETELFAPYAPTGLMKDSVRPINTDVLAVHHDSKFTLPIKTERIKTYSVWVPIKRKWTYKTVANSTNVSNGKTFLIIQAVDAQLTGTPPVTTTDISYFARLYYKSTE